MARTAKIAVSLDVEILRQLEQLRARSGESRSAAVMRALRLLTREDERVRQVEAYVRAYRDHPETNAEVAAARTTAARSLSNLVWEAE